MHFVLVHGAWHDGRVFDRLADALVARGHTAEAPDLPAHGADRTPACDVSLSDYIATVTAAVRAASGPRSVIVGHSFGGMAVAGAAARVPEAIAAALFVAAYLPRDGDSAASLVAGGRAPRIERAMQPDTEHGVVRIGRDAARALFYPGVPPDAADAALARLVPEPLAPLFESVALDEAARGRVAHGYVVCTRDRVLPPALQRAMATSVDVTVAELDSAHTPQLAVPEALADALVALATERRT